MHEGHAVNEIVTGKPVILGGTEGRGKRPGAAWRIWSSAPARHRADPGRLHGHRAGFGNVGSVSAYTLARRYGMTITGRQRPTAALFDPAGLPLDAIEAHVLARRMRMLAGFSSEGRDLGTELLEQRCDILVPAALDG